MNFKISEVYVNVVQYKCEFKNSYLMYGCWGQHCAMLKLSTWWQIGSLPGNGYVLVDVLIKCWECNIGFVLSAVLADLFWYITFFVFFGLHIHLSCICRCWVPQGTDIAQIVAVAHVHIWALGQVLWIRAQLLACGPSFPTVWGRWCCFVGGGASDQRDAGTFP